MNPTLPPPHRPRGATGRRRSGAAVAILAEAVLLASCATAPPPMPQRAPACAAAASAAQEGAAAMPVEAAGPASSPAIELRTRNAVYRSAAFDDLPGWRQDDLRTRRASRPGAPATAGRCG